MARPLPELTNRRCVNVLIIVHIGNEKNKRKNMSEQIN